MASTQKPSFGKKAAPARTPSKKAGPAKPGDKRASERKAAYKNCKIILSDRSVVDCIARNVSEKGCLISAAGAENLPEELVIQLDVISAPRRAKIVWVERGEAGIEFVSGD